MFLGRWRLRTAHSIKVGDFVDTEEEKDPDRKFPRLDIQSMSGKVGKSRGLRKRQALAGSERSFDGGLRRWKGWGTGL
jgi:hypothetical protein